MNSLFLTIYLLLTFILSSPLLIHIAYATDQTANSIIVHGGGTASIGCPDGASVDTDISFDAVKSVNGTILGNWTIDSTESTSLPTNGFNHGPIYLANLTTSSFYFQGETNDPQEQISLCSSPLFAPVTLLGQCGEDVTVTIQFQSNDPLDIANPFPADVECQLI
jgi:hypothetical protein